MVGIIFLNDINVCPYLDKYVDALNRLNEEYEIIIWDRRYKEGKKYKYPCRHIYKKQAKESVRPYFKLKDFHDYFNYVKKIIKQEKYDKLIVLSTLSGIYLYSTLKKYYRDKFIFDYRDASYEFIEWYKKRVRNIVDISAFTCISSPGFKNIIGDDESYVISHNFKYNDLINRPMSAAKNKNPPIRIGYIGILRNSLYMKTLINIFKNDERFILKIHGGGENFEELSEYAKEYNNIVLTGYFNEKVKEELISNIDILCYNYPNSFINDNALANKYYDAVIFKKPLLGNSATFSGRLVAENNLGISLVYSDEMYKDKLYEYYKDFDSSAFSQNAENMLNRILEEDGLYISEIEKFIKQ